MSLSHFDGLVWLLVLLGPLLLLKRSLHREIQMVFLLLTRRLDISLMLFSILFLPGVCLHELSHYLAATLLRVRTRGFSLVPKPLPDGRLQLGYVETAPADFIRDALIGFAPLLAGGVFVALAGSSRLGLLQLWDNLALHGSSALLDSLAALPAQPDFWLWFYLTFCVSSTMLPSNSDRQAWLPVGMGVSALLGLGLAAGAGPWMLAHLAPIVNQATRSMAVALGISVALHGALLAPVWGIRRLLMRLMRVEVA
jgi:hypothetical protein